MKEKGRVVVVSIDAMELEDLMELERMEELRAMFSRTSRVLNMETTFPSLTYPCHVTIMTGCTPGRHGFLHNEIFPSEGGKRGWKGDASAIPVPTVIDVAEKNGLRTAEICWPVSISSPSTYLFPEIWPPLERAEHERLLLSLSSPALRDVALRHLGGARGFSGRDLDELGTKIACDIIKEKDPDILFIHYAALDCSKHNRGAATERNLDAIRFTGKEVERLYRAAEGRETHFVLLGDHGQRDTRVVFNIAAALAKEGITGLKCHTAAFSSYVYPDTMTEEEARKALEMIMEKYPGMIDGIYGRDEIDSRYSTGGDFSFVLKAGDGVYLVSDSGGELVSAPREGGFNVASHGYFPEDGPMPPFLVAGPRATGIVVEKGSLMDEAPTILSFLGLDSQWCDGSVIKGLMEESV